jgi:hypothetical protein
VPYARAKADITQWAIIASLVLVLALAPSTVAGAVTSRDEPVEFLRHPIQGWRFVGTVLRASLSADLASPGAALRLAQHEWGTPTPRDQAVDRVGGDAADVVAVRVQLLYLPGSRQARVRTIDGTGSGSSSSLSARRALAWQVLGRPADGGQTATIGLIDYRTGAVLWDVRANNRKESPHT